MKKWITPLFLLFFVVELVIPFGLTGKIKTDKVTCLNGSCTWIEFTTFKGKKMRVPMTNIVGIAEIKEN